MGGVIFRARDGREEVQNAEAQGVRCHLRSEGRRPRGGSCVGVSTADQRRPGKQTPASLPALTDRQPQLAGRAQGPRGRRPARSASRSEGPAEGRLGGREEVSSAAGAQKEPARFLCPANKRDHP